MVGALLKWTLLQNETEHPPNFYICFRKHFKQNFEGKKIQHFLVLPSDLEVQKFRSKVKHIQNWARDLKQPLNDSSLYPEHIAFYFTEISLLGQELLAFKDWLSVPFWAIFRIFVTQFLKNGKPDREKISYFSKSVWVLPVYQKLSKSESVGCHIRG